MSVYIPTTATTRAAALAAAKRAQRCQRESADGLRWRDPVTGKWHLVTWSEADHTRWSAIKQ